MISHWFLLQYHKSLSWDPLPPERRASVNCVLTSCALLTWPQKISSRSLKPTWRWKSWILSRKKRWCLIVRLSVGWNFYLFIFLILIFFLVVQMIISCINYRFSRIYLSSICIKSVCNTKITWQVNSQGNYELHVY